MIGNSYLMQKMNHKYFINSMAFFLIDKDEFSFNGTIVKLEKQIVQYEIFEQYNIVVLLVSIKNKWEQRNEIIAIKNDYKDCKTIWTYQRKDATDNKTFRIYSIWKEQQNGIERVACFINSLGFYDETNIFNVETGEIIDTQLSK